MKILVVKLTSMGDVLHVLPALTDVMQHHDTLTVDWVVEESFREIPAWHPLVNRVIPVATRRWRKRGGQRFREIRAFWRALRETRYDYVIDAQGLLKSAFISRCAKGTRVGFCGKSIKESPAAWLYQKKISVCRKQHAIDRQRRLFAETFAYALPDTAPDYHISGVSRDVKSDQAAPYVCLLHGTTWDSKHLPEDYWHSLAQCALDSGYQVKLFWGNPREKSRADSIAADSVGVEVMPKLSLTDVKNVLSAAVGAVAVDTGLGHLAAALGVSCVSIYGATDAALTGAVGQAQKRLQMNYACSPCLKRQCDKVVPDDQRFPCYLTLKPEQIWDELRKTMSANNQQQGEKRL